MSLGTKISLALCLCSQLSGCGGGEGSSTPSGGGNGFTISGGITSSGSPVTAAQVNLYKTSYRIYSTNGLVSTRDANGVESVTLTQPPTASVNTSSSGTFAFNDLASGSYTIKPVSGSLLFKWAAVPTRDSIGVITITDSGTVYFYNPEGSGNQLSSDSTIIYNTGAPFTVTGRTLPNQDFEASLPGGSNGGV